jgi:hypothetical protein
LARVLLGRPIPDLGRVAPQRFFDTYNFPLTRDRVELLGIDVSNTAVEMGRLFSANAYEGPRTTRGISRSFSARTSQANDSTRYREPRIWVIDFNQVAPFDRTEGQIPRLIEAFFANEAYLPRPRPSDELYQVFSQAYIAECGKIDNVAVMIGRMFIEASEREQNEPCSQLYHFPYRRHPCN